MLGVWKAAVFPLPAEDGRKAKHLLPPVNDFCFPGCIFWIVEFNGYNKFKTKYKHGTVCHKREFLSAKGVCANAVGSLWSLIKGDIRKGWKGVRGVEEGGRQKVLLLL